MEQTLEYGNSFYQFSFFTMKVDVPGDLKVLKDIQEYYLGIYFHEYIHFIQDISTIYGLMNMSNTTYYIQSCASYISRIKDSKEFNAPITIETLKNARTNQADFGILNHEVKPIYMGNAINPKSKTVRDLRYEIHEIKLSNNAAIDVVKMEFFDQYDEKRVFQFGGAILTEGMAYLCEQQLFSGILPKSDEYPYSIVEKVVELIYPELAEDKVAIVTLCDISLMTYHPGLSFIRLLTYVKKQNLMTEFNDPIIFYEKCNAFLKGVHHDFDVIADYVRDEIKKNFNDPLFEDIHNWLDLLFDNVKYLRKQLPQFVTGMILDDNLLINKYFNEVFDLLGTPLVLNGDGEAIITYPKGFKPKESHSNVGLFMAINQALRIFYLDKPTPCKLKKNNLF
ncbi:hypothetical protein HNP24_001813 [Chryseobacterium sediminis]|uniref:Uncharacterized protein n=1 Tax=Chryseobacterium sediminis TaxID=1679494 RepID=A0ABR6PYR8_9FLAO|nr:hypothetical protein [Chryseobacterium sediminis]MBB6330863.1 hypothetical protein [Chryseobacterium sediminis]